MRPSLCSGSSLWITPRPAAPVTLPNLHSRDWNADLAQMLASPQLGSARRIWEQYDQSVGASTVVGPGADAALLLAFVRKARVIGREMIVAAAEQEDADVVGMSSLSGVHNYFFPKVVAPVVPQGSFRPGCSPHYSRLALAGLAVLAAIAFAQQLGLVRDILRLQDRAEIEERLRQALRRCGEDRALGRRLGQALGQAPLFAGARR